jgi:hypothetical protein
MIKPKKDETHDEFMNRGMGDEQMQRLCPDRGKRMEVLASMFQDATHIRTPTDKPSREDKLVARIEVCEGIERYLAAQRKRTGADEMWAKGIDYMAEVIKSHRETAKESLAGIEKVVLQICTNDDHYRLIPRNTLRDVMAEYETSEDKQAGANRARQAMWNLSDPADVSSSGQVDYVIVPDDNESWRDLVSSLREEEQESK